MKSREEMIHFGRKALGLSGSVNMELNPLAARGSDRSFFRLMWGAADSAILIHYDPKRLENAYYADIASFLRDIGVSVPGLIGHDPAGCFVLVEDMGADDLWSFKDNTWETRKVLYQKTLTNIHNLHSFPEKDFPIMRVRLMDGFSPDLYLWEREYFKDNFVVNICGITLDPSSEQALESELSGLADRLAGTRRCLIHRDLQSQNVMIRDGEPFFIDFQGMRMGCAFYDLGSLLCDPYVVFSDTEIDELLSFYYGLSDREFDWLAFRDHFWQASAQRLMQALGAYGFLGLKRGLKTFIDHIPAGLRNLHRAASHTALLPLLLELSGACQRQIEGNNILHQKI